MLWRKSTHIHIQKILKTWFGDVMYIPFQMTFYRMSVYFLGMLWQELKQVYSEGIYNYFEALYNYLDFAVLTLYIASFTLRFLTLIKVRQLSRYVILADEINHSLSITIIVDLNCVQPFKIQFKTLNIVFLHASLYDLYF